jgi:gamma-carbonic anhydrase
MTGRILAFRDQFPRIASDAFIAPDATVIGDVEIGAGSSIWFNCTIRGDVNYIRIGSRTNIQDGSVVHVSRGTHPTVIGSNILIGHMCLIHGCVLEDGCFIGMKACVMDGVVVESGAMVAAGALVTPGKRVLKGQLWSGSPAKYMRDLTEKDIANIPRAVGGYSDLGAEYRLALTGQPIPAK